MHEIELWTKKKYYSPDNYNQTSDRGKKCDEKVRAMTKEVTRNSLNRINIAVERVTISRFLKKQNALLPFNFVYIIAYHRRQL